MLPLPPCGEVAPKGRVGVSTRAENGGRSAAAMHYYPERRVSRAAVWSRRLAFFSAVLFVTAAVGHRLAMLPTPGFIVVLGVVAGIALAALVLAAFGFARLWNHGDVAGRNIAAAVFVALVVLAPFGLGLYRGLTLPRLTDVSTDLEDPPELRRAAQSQDMNPITPFTEEEKRLQLETYPLVTGRRYAMTFDRVLDAVVGSVQARGWQLVPPLPDPSVVETTVHAAARTWLFGFPADVAIRLTDEETTTYVDMRSASRYGDHGLGDNPARIVAFLSDLDARISALAGMLPAEPAEGEPDEDGLPEIPTPEPRPQN